MAPTKIRTVIVTDEAGRVFKLTLFSHVDGGLDVRDKT